MTTKRFITKGRGAGRKVIPLKGRSACPVKMSIFHNTSRMPMNNLRAAVAAEHTARLNEQERKIMTDEGLQEVLEREGKHYAGDTGTVREKLRKHLEKKHGRRVEEDIKKIVDVSSANDFSGELIVTVDWKKSYMWGSNPRAVTNYGHESERLGGSGYDKLSTVVAEVLNQHLPLLKLLYVRKNKDYDKWKGAKSQSEYNESAFGYGLGYSILPDFEGGVGVSAHQRIMDSIGLEMRSISSTDSVDVFMITKARKRK